MFFFFFFSKIVVRVWTCDWEHARFMVLRKTLLVTWLEPRIFGSDKQCYPGKTWLRAAVPGTWCKGENPDLRVSRPASWSQLCGQLLDNHFAFRSSVSSSENEKVLLNDQWDNSLSPLKKIFVWCLCNLLFFSFFLYLWFYLLRLYTRGQWYINIINYECIWYCI